MDGLMQFDALCAGRNWQVDSLMVILDVLSQLKHGNIVQDEDVTVLTIHSAARLCPRYSHRSPSSNSCRLKNGQFAQALTTCAKLAKQRPTRPKNRITHWTTGWDDFLRSKSREYRYYSLPSWLDGEYIRK
jgi:hypothetical protein